MAEGYAGPGVPTSREQLEKLTATSPVGHLTGPADMVQPRQAELPSIIDELSAQVGSLHATLDELEQRCLPIARSEETAPGGAVPTDPRYTSTGNMLQHSLDGVRVARDRVRYLIERLEV